jgi:molecular chaperone HtpG
MMAYFTEFDGTPFKSVAKGDIDLSALSKSEAEEDDAEKSSDADALDADLLKKVTEVLGERVSEVRSSQRLTDSASCLVLGDQEMALHLQRLLEQAGQDLPDSRPVLELNPEHALVSKLKAEEDEQQFADLSLVLFDQALLSEGGSLADPASFVARVNSLIA